MRRPGWIVGLALAVAVAVAGLGTSRVAAGSTGAGASGGLGGSRSSGFRIVVAPRASSRFSDTWSFASSVTPGCPVRMGPVLVGANAWNLRPAARGGACIPSATEPGASTGAITWSLDRRGVTMSAAIAHTERAHPLTPVAAYPELIYGWSPFFGIASRQAAALRFPIPVERLAGARQPDPVLSTDYVLCAPCLSRGPIDLAYDLWISPNRRPLWCGHGATPPPGCVTTPSGAIEVMIWLAHSTGFHPVGALARGAAFTPRGWLNGRRVALHFGTYVCSGCSHDIVSFVLAGRAGAAMPRGLLHGSVAVNLDPFLAQALRRVGRSGGYLDGIEFGSEIAPVRDGATTRFWFTLRSYCLSSRVPACS
jgi:hypothetical protein